MHIDFEGIASGLLASKEHRRWLPDGKLQGHEWVARNPTRGDKKPGSFSVNENTGKWADFSTGDKGGDLVSLCAYLEGTTQGEAAKRLGGFELKVWERPAPVVERAPVEPIPEGQAERAACRLQHNDRWHDPSRRWVYRTAEGVAVMVVCRYDFGPGDKTCRPWKWLNGKMVQGVISEPRPLYGLEWALQNPSLPVLVVEGEKSADAAQEALGEDFAVVTWQGGAKAAEKTDWSPLKGRVVVLWPDADAPGAKAMEDVARLCGAAELRAVAVPEGVPEGWDCADILDLAELVRMVEGACMPAAGAPPVDVDALGLSEDDLATRFERLHSGHLLYDHDKGAWWVWRDAQWEPDRMGAVQQMVREMCRSIECSERERGRLTKLSTWNNVRTTCTTTPTMATTSDRWDADPWVAGCPDGMVDLRTGAVRPATPHDRITKRLGATPKPGTPTRWLEFLHEATGSDTETMDYLQRLAGYCLTGSTREQGLWFIYGQGGNGKGTFMRVLMALLGSYGSNSPAETFAAGVHERHPEELARLNGARLVTVAETKTGGSWNEQRIKELTGGDPVTARFMNQNSFTYTPQFKLVMSGNHRPSLRVVDEAMRRRFHVVPFTTRPTTVDHDLSDRLLLELPQIASWAVRGCLDWQHRGMVKSARVEAETNAYFESQDTVQGWLDDRCDIGAVHWTATGELYESWKRFAEGMGEHPGSAKSFAQELMRRGFQPTRTKLARGFSGLRVSGDTSGRQSVTR